MDKPASKECEPVELAIKLLESIEARRRFEMLPSRETRRAWGEAHCEVDASRSRCGYSDLSEVIPTSRDGILLFLGSRGPSESSLSRHGSRISAASSASVLSVDSYESLSNSAKSATSEPEQLKLFQSNLVAHTSESLFPCDLDRDA